MCREVLGSNPGPDRKNVSTGFCPTGILWGVNSRSQLRIRIRLGSVWNDKQTDRQTNQYYCFCPQFSTETTHLLTQLGMLVSIEVWIAEVSISNSCTKLGLRPRKGSPGGFEDTENSSSQSFFQEMLTPAGTVAGIANEKLRVSKEKLAPIGLDHLLERQHSLSLNFITVYILPFSAYLEYF